MTNKAIVICAMLVIGVIGTTVVSGQQRFDKTIAVVHEDLRQPIIEYSFPESFNRRMTMWAEGDIILPERDSLLPPAPDGFDVTRLYEWGTEIGCRYIMYIRVDDRSIVKRRKIAIPLLVTHYVVEGKMTGRYSLLDLRRNKVVDTWELNTRVPGPHQWQIMDDYPGDPDLMIPAPEKMRFYRAIEERAIEDILTTVEPHLRGR